MSPSPRTLVRHRTRRRVLLGAWLLAGSVLLARAGVVQVLQGAHWEAVALAQHRKPLEVPAPRGTILDRNGNPMVASFERYRVEVAPRELAPGSRDSVVALLASELDLSPRTVGSIRDTARKWVTVPGRYPPHVREPLQNLRGVYLTRQLNRFYPHESLARGVLGSVIDRRGRGGIEEGFEDHLQGRPGREVQARDSEGRPIPGQSYLVQPPVAGGDVVLTLDRDLQEIGREALRAAVDRTGARGGDLLISSPTTGEILAMVSLRNGSPAGLTGITTPYEPGSTLKPFTVAGLLKHGLASLTDSVETEEGWWRVEGRTLVDVHAHGTITLADALRVSSNVGIARMARALSPGQQYQILRDFGFGSPTGIPIPGEAPGKLRRPGEWSAQSPASLAIGYEISVTPLQMVMAYGALANGGKLMEPRLVREMRDPSGRVIHRTEPRVVRRVIPSSITRKLAPVLREVVEDGTGTQARLATFAVAGKSGTSRAYATNGGYAAGGHYASFVCFFPVDDPQLVVYVKLERPEGAYYGGATAAPVTRATMEAILAARQAPIDREAVASPIRQQPRTSPLPGAQFASTFSSSLPPARTPRAQHPPETGAPVPDVSGLPPRLAVRHLHAQGLRVLLTGPGPVNGTRPPPGARLTPGDTVVVVTGRLGHD